MGPNIKLCVGPPDGFSQAELDTFIGFVVSAETVVSASLTNLVSKAMALAMLYCDNVLIGSAGLKHPNDTYHKRIFTKAGATSHSNYPLELGWVHVDGNHGKKEFGMKLSSAVLEYANDNGIYATTPDKFMSRILVALDFTKTGNSYKSRDEKKNLSLFIRPTQ